MRIAQQSPANPAHHRTVTAHQRGKCGLVVTGQETLEKLSVRQLPELVGEHDAAQMLQDVASRAIRHDAVSPGSVDISHSTAAKGAGGFTKSRCCIGVLPCTCG